MSYSVISEQLSVTILHKMSKSVQKLYWLEQIQSLERLLVGEKAFALSQLRQQGYPIQPGFVVIGAEFRGFLENLSHSASLLADFPHSSLHLDVNNYKALQLLAQQSRQAIIETPIPNELLSQIVDAAQSLNSPNLIFRVSVAFPAVMPTNLTGLFPSQISQCEPVSIELALKQAWASLFGAKSLFYWQRLGIKLEQLNIAILVQPMSNAIASGIAYMEADSLRIQSTWGLGHSLLYGEVLPDIYEILLSSGIIEVQHLGNKSHAYRLKPQSQSGNCLEAYSLSQTALEDYSLAQASLEELIQLSQRLSREKNYRGSLEWTLTSASEQYPCQLYITQLLPNLTAPFPSWKNPTPEILRVKEVRGDTQPLLTGIGTSSGVVTALTHVIADDDSPDTPVAIGKILVTKQLTPNWLPWLKQATGIITEVGGMTSHAAILARELGIPAIVGATKATALLTTGESILMDGDKGEIHQQKVEVRRQEVEVRRQKVEVKLLPNSYPIGTQLMVNLSQTSLITRAAALPVNGLGLLRSELMLVDLFREKPIQEWLQSGEKSLFVEELAQLIQEFAIAFAPKPIFYRSLDGKMPQEANILSWQRGTYSYQLDPTLFDCELQALLAVQKAGYANVNLILPFVRSVEEFTFCRQRVERIGLNQASTFELWIMAEVPSVIFLLPEYVKAGVQGIAIGTNDLAQLLLGVERDQSTLPVNWQICHPAFLEAIKQLIKQAQSANIPCSICGEAPGQYLQLIDHLVRWGVTTISVEPQAVERIYQAIAEAEKRLLLEAARQQLNLLEDKLS